MKKTQKISILIVALLLQLASTHVSANLWFNSNCKTAYEKMISLDMQGAQKILAIDKRQNPRNSVAKFIGLYGDFIRISLSESRDEYDSFFDNADKLLDDLESEDISSPWRLYFMSDIHLQIAMLHSLDKSYLSAMNHSRKAHARIKENIELFPHFLPNNKSMGILNVMLGSIPEDYDWVFNILGVRGSVSDGIDQLNALADAAAKKPEFKWLQTEAFLIWSFTTFNYENENKELTEKQKARLEKMTQMAKSNPLMCYTITNYYRKQGNNDKAIQVLKSFTYIKGHQRLYFLDYMLAESYLYKMDSQCISHFENYLQRFPGNYYRKSALQRMAWYYLMTHDMKKYQTLMTRVLKEGDTFLDGDKKANKAAKNEEQPNAYLLKCRLLFDGGYYAEATRVFKVHSPMVVLKTTKDRVEHPYRMGRIYDQWGKRDLAVKYYLKTISMGKDESWYFAANAALHLGQIYEEEGNKAEAKKMYQACLDMDFDEYRNSITQKAKAGLNRLEE
jgi:tetratricopeptide (TPR) repeat protein